MTLKVVQGLVANPVRPSTDTAGSTSNAAAQKAPVKNDQEFKAKIEGIVNSAAAVSAAGEAVVTTIRASSKAAAQGEVRSLADAEKLARKVAKEVSQESREGEALNAHSGLDSVSRSGRGKTLL